MSNADVFVMNSAKYFLKPVSPLHFSSEKLCWSSDLPVQLFKIAHKETYLHVLTQWDFPAH